MKVAFHTLGCKLNQFETTAIAQSLGGIHEIVDFAAEADVYVINSCSVTGKAEAECRRLVRRTARLHPESAVVVAGCYAQRSPRDLAALPGVSAVLGNRDKMRLSGALEEHGSPLVSVDGIGVTTAERFPLIDSFGGLTRAFVKIQDGCDSRCAYCVVWQVRGPSVSIPAATVLRQVERLAASGFREVVLTGIHLGTWGIDQDPPDSLAALLARLDALEDGPRLRLSSVEPREFDDGLIRVLADGKRICRHLHIPLQSGSDRILGVMNRTYSAEEYGRLVERLCARMPGLAVGADVMVGFPGETDDDFRQTMELIRGLPLAYLHVFVFSPRPGTAAAALPNPVHPETKKERGSLVRSLGRAKARDFRERLRGSRLSCLVETRRDAATGLLKAISDNYLKILLDGPDSFMNTFVDVRVDKVEDDHVTGSHEA